MHQLMLSSESSEDNSDVDIFSVDNYDHENDSDGKMA